MHPQARVGRLSETFDLSLDRQQTDPTAEEFDGYTERFPKQGMPFAMPNLSDTEYRILVQWLAQGAHMPAAKRPSASAARQIERWETADCWFHDDDRREQPIQAGLLDLNRYQNW